MFAAADKALLFQHHHGYEAVKPIWQNKDGNENEDYQVNSEYVFAYNNKDRHKDVYGVKTRKDRSKDRYCSFFMFKICRVILPSFLLNMEYEMLQFVLRIALYSSKIFRHGAR